MLQTSLLDILETFIGYEMAAKEAADFLSEQCIGFDESAHPCTELARQRTAETIYHSVVLLLAPLATGGQR